MVVPTEYDSHLAPLREPGEELVGAARGVGTDQCGPSAAVALGELGQGEPGGGDVVGGGVGSRVPRPQQGCYRPSGAAASVVRRSPSGGGDVRTIFSRSRPRPACRSGPTPALRPGPRSPDLPHPVPCPWPTSRRARVLRPGPSGSRSGPCPPAAARVSISRETVGPQATGPNTVGSARTIPASARQSPPSATARATSSRILPGSGTARGRRHGVSAADIALSRPGLRAVSTSSTPPACETTPLPPPSMRTRG